MTGKELKNEANGRYDFFSQNLLNWWQKNNRNYLFWRKTKNPYHIIIAEILLQKTTANQVSEVIEEFLKKFPTPQALAQAPTKETKKIISPLGLQHKRSLTLQKLARQIVEKHHSKIPSSEKALLSLPGVGKYIANSVLCFAFGEQVPIVDTNVDRIMKRVFDSKKSKTQAEYNRTMWKLAQRIVEASNHNARDINLALLDYGALVCTSKKPKCTNCFASSFCKAFM